MTTELQLLICNLASNDNPFLQSMKAHSEWKSTARLLVFVSSHLAKHTADATFVFTISALSDYNDISVKISTSASFQLINRKLQ